ncbi:hypothetical protein LTR37_014525 [Vermiconidia calcicola]|uniref:Uncharacterized protein n=1 Tax=Vermiconidia calcicola TaxID=1690605 RepID=A0ACC3MTB4_9PEZI|nr:hypothetical protein LTR37_014525 [Vermiconidia calcicola]
MQYSIALLALAATVFGAPQSYSVTQISDGQIQQATSAAPVSQISDGQIQAATSAVILTPSSVPVAPVTQISDGQIQAPTSTVPVVTQISDGQIQAPYPTGGAPTGALPTGTGVIPASSYAGPVATGAAAINGPAAGLLAAGAFAIAMI